MAKKGKFYVVWEGKNPGIYDNWEDAKDQVTNVKNARYKSFTSRIEATKAPTATWRGSPTCCCISTIWSRRSNAVPPGNLLRNKPHDPWRNLPVKPWICPGAR
jgi:ribonuclease HI